MLYLKYFSTFKTRPKIVADLLKMRSFRMLANNNAKAQVQNDTEDVDKPIEYLKSGAAQWKAHISRTGTVEQYPWYQTYVIAASLTIFMIYFFILREESDIDLELEKNLYDRIEGLEEKQLEIVIEYNISQGLPYDEERKRLAQLRQNK